MSIIYLALGTNIGDRRANLHTALAALPPEVAIVTESGIYETPAWGYEDQPPFLNMVVKAETNLAPLALLEHLKSLESELGRAPTFRWGPRLIDMDILFYDSLALNSPQLVVPHPRLQERAFVLVPLAEIAPELLHPVLGKTIRQLVEQVDGSDILPYSE